MTQPVYRFYSFVAGLYLSPLQRGLQTAHAVSEMHANLLQSPDMTEERAAYDTWCLHGKTIVICDALNSAGVVEAYNKLKFLSQHFGLPVSIFHEDVASLNGAPTATGIVVPDYLFDAKLIKAVKPEGVVDTIKSFFKTEAENPLEDFYRFETTTADGVLETVDVDDTTDEFEFIKYLKSFRLAQS